MLAASCAGDSSTETSEEPVAGEYAAEEETAKIVGVAEGASDVGAGDYHPLTSGTVAFFSPDEEAQLWSDLSFEPEEYRLTTVGGGIDAGGLSQGQLAPISEGRFKADVEDGAYLVCLIAGDGPWSLRGCGRMSVEGPADWVLSHDEGGVFVYEATAQ